MVELVAVVEELSLELELEGANAAKVCSIIAAKVSISCELGAEAFPPGNAIPAAAPMFPPANVASTAKVAVDRCPKAPRAAIAAIETMAVRRCAVGWVIRMRRIVARYPARVAVFRASLVPTDRHDNETRTVRVDIYAGPDREANEHAGRLRFDPETAEAFIARLNEQVGPFPRGVPGAPDLLEGLYARPWA